MPGVDTFISAVDKADKSSDRWLFLATVIVLVLFCAAVIRYLIKDREASRKEHAEQLTAAYGEASKARQEHAATMKEMYGEQTKLAAHLLVALQENKLLLEQVERCIDRNNNLLSSMEKCLDRLNEKSSK